MIEANPAAACVKTGASTFKGDEASPAPRGPSAATAAPVVLRGPSTAMLIDRGRKMSSLPAMSPPPALAGESPMTLAGVFDEAFDESSLDGATMFVDAVDSRVEQLAALEIPAAAPLPSQGSTALPRSPALPDWEKAAASPAAPVAPTAATLAVAPAVATAVGPTAALSDAPAAVDTTSSSDAEVRELRAALKSMRAEQERAKALCGEAEEANWKLTDEWQVELAKNAALQQRVATLEREAESAPAPDGAEERAPTALLKTPRSRLARAEDTRNSPRVNDLETHLCASRQKCSALQSSLSDARAELAAERERCASLDLAASQRAVHERAQKHGAGGLEQQLLATREISEELQGELQSAQRDKAQLAEQLRVAEIALSAARVRCGDEAAKAASAELGQLRRENDAVRARCNAMELDTAKAGRDAASRRVAEQAKHEELVRERSARVSLENEKESFAKQRKEIVRSVASPRSTLCRCTHASHSHPPPRSAHASATPLRARCTTDRIERTTPHTHTEHTRRCTASVRCGGT